MGTAAAALALMLAGTQTGGSIQPLLDRLSEEAEVFRRTAPRLLAQETLRQRVLDTGRRFRPRIVKPPAEAPELHYRTREIVSEYGYGTLSEAPDRLHEFRQVIWVDGRRIAAPQSARRKLLSGLRASDDRLKRRMLEEFERYGLRGAAADFGQLVLLFTRRRLADYAFQIAGKARVGAEPAQIIRYRQIAGAESLTIFERGQALRRPVEGELWLRDPDGLPLRITLESRGQQEGRPVTDRAAVDYLMSSHGVITPASVVRRRLIGEILLVEDVFEYSSFRLFSADAEIKFPP